MLIGISGYIGSGKDTVATMIQALTMPKKGYWYHHPIEYLKNYEGYTNLMGEWGIKKFAGKLKQIVSLLTGIPVDDLEKESVKSSELGPEWNKHEWLGNKTYEEAGSKPMTVRTLLQRVGTEAMRNQVHEDIWVNALFADYKEEPLSKLKDSNGVRFGFEKWSNWIISDCRFGNEAKAIKDRGGIVVRINRPNGYSAIANQVSRHPSETSLDNWQFDYTIENSGTLEELLEQVRIMLLHFKIIT